MKRMLRKTKKSLTLSNNLQKKDEAINKVNERLETAVKTAPIAFMIIIDGKVIELNESARIDLGLEIGDTVIKVYPDPSKRVLLLKDLADRKTIFNEIMNIKFADGEIHRCLSNISLIEYNHHSAISVWLSDIEHVEQKKDDLRANQQNLQNIIDTMPISACIINTQTYEIIYGNLIYTQKLGEYTTEKVVGISVTSTLFDIKDDELSIVDLIALPALSETPITRDIQVTIADSKTLDLRIYACPINYKGQNSILCLQTNLEAEKKQQKMFQCIAKKEKEANEQKSRFLVNLSHEIRTPMNAILGLTEIELKKNVTTASADIYKKINSSAKSMLYVINNILDLSTVESNKLVIYSEEFVLEDVLYNAMLVATPLVYGKNVKFLLDTDVNLPHRFFGDKTKLWQILSNLLSNSAKYTNNGKIVLTVLVDKEQSNDETVMLAFTIEDTGIGLNENQLKEVFKPFTLFRSESQSNLSGTGLGIPLSKKFCEKMGGRMTIESKVGLGTKLFFTIPFKQAQNKETAPSTLISASSEEINALIVEKDALSLNIISNALIKNSITSIAVKSAEEAIKLINDYNENDISFHVIIIGCLLDSLSSIGIVKQINTYNNKVPKLLIAAPHQKQILEQKLESFGICEVIEMPFVPSHFIHALSELLGGSSESNSPDERFIAFKDVNILVCEDNSLNQEIINGMLNHFKISTKFANNGKHAIEILMEDQSFDLIFMDLQMPIIDGYDTTKIIRSDSRFESTPVICITADAKNEVIDKCLAVGMNDLISKPIEFDNLYITLSKWLPERKRVSVADPDSWKIKSASIATSIKQKPKPANDDAYKEALARFGGDVELYNNAIITFAQSLRDTWPAFEEAINIKQETLREVHSIKGLAGSLAITDIYWCAIDFEKSLRNDRPDQALYNILVEACTSFRKKYISHEHKTSDIVVMGDGTEEEFASLISKLEVALENFDPIITSEVIDSLRGKNWQFCDMQLLGVLCEHATEYRFIIAYELLESIKR